MSEFFIVLPPIGHLVCINDFNHREVRLKFFNRLHYTKKIIKNGKKII